MITSMNFINPVIVGGRTVTGLGSDYLAEMLDFPWVKVWSKDRPDNPRLTTVFNVRCCEMFTQAELMIEVDADSSGIGPPLAAALPKKKGKQK